MKPIFSFRTICTSLAILLASASLQAQTADAYEPNDALETATQLPVAIVNGTDTVKTVNASCHVSTDVDYYFMVVPYGATMFKARLHDSYQPGDGNTYTCDAKFNYSIDGGATWSGWTDTSMGSFVGISGDTVYFSVTPYSSTRSGTYALEVYFAADANEPNNTPQTATLLPFAFAANDSASVKTGNTFLHIAGDVDYFRVNLPARNADVTAFFTAKLKNAYFESESIYNLNGKFSYSLDGGATWSNQTYSQFGTPLHIPNHCNYILFKVEGYSSSALGTYSLEVNAFLQTIPVNDVYEPNDNVANATVLTATWTDNIAQIITDTANMHLGSDLDFYRIDLPESQTRMIQFKITPYYNSNYICYLYSFDGGATWSSRSFSRMNEYVDVPYGCNTLYIQAQAYSSSYLGRYGLQIDLRYASDNDYWWRVSADTLYINGQGATPDYANTGQIPWYGVRNTIKHVVVGQGITGIGRAVFYGLQKAEIIDLPANITTIGVSAFEYTDSLKTIALPAALATIGSEAFRYSGITSITIPDGVVALPNNAFYQCRKLSNVQLPATLTSIGNGAFYYCDSLRNIVLPPSLTVIGSEAFRSCSNLTSIHLPANLLTIGASAFYGSGLKTVNIPPLLTTANQAFRSCPLETVTFDNGCLAIPERTFQDCPSLANVTIPTTVTNIGVGAFYNCPKLKNFNFHNSLTTIGNGAFYNTALQTVVIPNSVTTLGNDVFNHCDSLVSATIGTGITTLSNNTFYNCAALASVSLPEGLTAIGERAFYGAKSLTQITLPASLTSIGYYAFQNSGLTAVSIPENVRAMGAYCFANCSALTTFSAANGITYLGGKAFANDSALVNVSLPASLTVIDDNAFNSCVNLTSIVLPQRVARIYSSAFYHSGITAITIPSSVTYIDDSAFEGCTGLTEIAVPSSTTGIGGSAFANCTNLQQARFSRSSAPSFSSSNHFAGCLALDTIWVPQGAMGSYVSALSGKLPARTPATVIAEMGVSQQIPNIANVQPPFATYHTQYSYPLYVTGVDTIVWEVIDGVLPQGLSLDSAGVISGYPTEVGNFTFTVKASNSFGDDTQVIHFGVQQKNVGGGVFTFLHEFSYTGLPIMPNENDFVYVLGEDTLVYGTDYTFNLSAYYNNINKGNNAYFYIYGIGNFKSYTHSYFTIGKADYTYTIPATIAVQQGNGLDDIAEDVPKTATGLLNQQVTGATSWYSNAERSLVAVDTDLSSLSLGASTTLYWTFQPDSVKNANYTGQPKMGATQFTAANLPPLVYSATDTLDAGKAVIYISDTTLAAVGGRYLTQPLTMQIVGADAQYFSYATPADWKPQKGGNLKIAFRPEELRFYNADLILQSATAKDTLHLTGKGIMPTSYTVTANVAQAIFAPQDTIEITGTATYSNGMAAANVRVDILLQILGYSRTYQITTDANGNYAVTYVSQQGEAGHYTLKAYKPGTANPPIIAQFDIPGFQLTSSYVRWEVFKDIPVTGNVQFKNRSNIPLNNIQFEIIQGLPNAEVTLNPIAQLAGNGYAMMEYSVVGTVETASSLFEAIKVRATSEEGVAFDFYIMFFCKPTRGVIGVNPTSVKTNMTKGESKLVEIELVNNGNGPTGDIVTLIPNVEWMTLASADTLPSLEPTESTKISLWLEPKETTQLNTPFTGNLAVNCSNGNSLTIPYNIQAISDSTGVLIVDVVDEYFYNTTEAPHLRDAHVLVKHPFSFVTVADGYTDSTGIFRVPNLAEGYWTLMVEAPNHESYRNNILIEAGQNNYKQVFISFDAVTYTWTVVPTEIEDRYDIVLTTQYQTNVPVPVVQVDMPENMPYLTGEEEYNFNAVVTNLGLITAEDVSFTPPDDSEYGFSLMINDFNLAAHTSQVVPIRMYRLDAGGNGSGGGDGSGGVLRSGGSGSGAGSSPCGGYWKIEYKYICGEATNYMMKSISKGAKWTERNCYGLDNIPNSWGMGPYEPSIYGSSGGSGSSSSSSNYTPPITIKKDCDDCDPMQKQHCIEKFTWLALGKLPVVGCFASVGDTWTDLSFPQQSGWKDENGKLTSDGFWGIVGNGGSMLLCLATLGYSGALEGIAEGVGNFADNYGTAGTIRECCSSGCLSFCNEEILGGGGTGGEGGSGGSGGSEPNNAPSLLRSAAENRTLTDEYYVERMNMLDKSYNAHIAILGEIYNHDTTLINHSDFVQFKDAVNQYTQEHSVIPANDYNVQTCGVPDSVYLPFVQRWNNTIAAWNDSIFVPDEQHPDIINLDTIAAYTDSIIAAYQYAVSKGYATFEEMAFEVAFALQTVIDEENEKKNSQGSVCASVTMEIKQRMTMTREAFRGTLTIHNGHNTLAMENVNLELEVRDENGELQNDLFQINTESLTGALTGIDGSGSLGAESDGAANILFIPEIGAAPTETKIYSFGGVLSYDDPFTGARVTVSLFPVALEVHPSPNLDLLYFMQRDVLGDDALTEPIEPIVPADLAVMIHNKGYGTAKNVQIESAQPKIVENEKGLLINFNIIGSSLGAQQKQLGMMNVNFGNIEPQTATVGHWWLTSSLLGHFVSYDARITHLDSYGNPDLSLVDTIEIHELIHSVRAYGNDDDNILDFLVNDYPDSRDYPDGLYYSDASYHPVHLADTAYVDGNVSTNDLIISLSIQPSEVGWNYARLNDPARGKYKLAQVTRNDGVQIPLDNVWQTFVTLDDNHEPLYEDKIHIADTFPTMNLYTYNLVFSQINTNTLKVDSIVGLPQPEAGQTIPLIAAPQQSLTVYFDRPVYRPSFTWEDLELHTQGGLNIADNTVVIDSISPRAYRVNLGGKTSTFGYYNFIVNTLDVIDINRNSGYLGKQVEWIQNLSSTTVIRDVTRYDVTIALNNGDGFSYLYQTGDAQGFQVTWSSGTAQTPFAEMTGATYDWSDVNLVAASEYPDKSFAPFNPASDFTIVLDTVWDVETTYGYLDGVLTPQTVTVRYDRVTYTGTVQEQIPTAIADGANDKWRIIIENGELKIENGRLNDTVRIYNLSGQIILNSQLSILNSINISHLPHGVYIVRVGKQAAKFVK